jgi:hypothetical protein
MVSVCVYVVQIYTATMNWNLSYTAACYPRAHKIIRLLKSWRKSILFYCMQLLLCYRLLLVVVILEAVEAAAVVVVVVVFSTLEKLITLELRYSDISVSPNRM